MMLSAECGRLEHMMPGYLPPTPQQENSTAIVPPTSQSQQETDLNEDDKFTRVHTYMYKRGENPLFWAAREGNQALVEQLLRVDGSDVDRVGEYGWTPLMIAAEHGHSAVVKALLLAVNPSSKDKLRRTPRLLDKKLMQ
jgi:ankyrin repeat protein